MPYQNSVKKNIHSTLQTADATEFKCCHKTAYNFLNV